MKKSPKNRMSKNDRKKSGKKRRQRVEKFLVGSADAGKRLGGHRVNRLVLCDAQGILIADKRLRVQLERLAHQLGNTVQMVSI